MSFSSATPAPSPPDTMRADLFTAYLAAGAKIASWAIVAAILFRNNVGDYAMFALARATLGILNYTSLGLAPAMIQAVGRSRRVQTQYPTPLVAPLPAIDDTIVLSYSSAPVPRKTLVDGLIANGIVVAVFTALVGVAITIAYGKTFMYWHRMPYRLEQEMPNVVFWMGLGAVVRLSSDVFGSVLQTHGRIALDNRLLVLTEVIWIVAAFPIFSVTSNTPIGSWALAYVVASMALLGGRALAVLLHEARVRPDWSAVSFSSAAGLLGYGSLIAVAQLADFLYAPTDFILINHFLGPLEVAAYAPAVQIDSAMLVLVAGLASVLLPKAAIAHAGGDISVLRRYYFRGTAVSVALLGGCAAVIYFLSDMIFRIWLGDPSITTQLILPLVFIHTVVGGSSAVGRSVLLGMGKVKAFTIAALVAGGSNVVLSYVFVRYFDWGLKGIVLGTIIAVVGRCVIWMPWYVLRTLRREQASVDANRAIVEDVPPVI